jgi:hypothetical protein
MCAGISIYGTVLIGTHFNDMMTGFINPEFGALKTITEVVGKLK